MDNIIETIDLLTKKFKTSLYSMRYRAKKKGIEFDITFDNLRDLYFTQKARCFYSGLPFDFEDPMGVLSVDRVDNAQGYIEGNVVWCRFGVNSLKSSRTYEGLVDICKKVVFHHPDWKMLDE